MHYFGIIAIDASMSRAWLAGASIVHPVVAEGFYRTSFRMSRHLGEVAARRTRPGVPAPGLIPFRAGRVSAKRKKALWRYASLR